MTEASTANGSGPVTGVPRGGIGSDFHSPDLGPEVTPPWEQYYSEGSLTYFSTGRQALYALAEKLEPRGYHMLLVPDYFCESMLVSFEARGWNFVSYPLLEDLSVDWSALRELAQQQEDSFAVLVPRYFAPRADDCPTLEFQTLQELGAFVIVDETHTVFNPEALAADAAIASLRKMLPVADGAYLWTHELEIVPPLGESEAASARWSAMDLKDVYLQDGSRSDFRVFMTHANHALDAETLPRGPSQRSMSSMRHLNYAELARTRQQNYSSASAAAQSLSNVSLLFDTNAPTGVPAFFTVRVPDPKDSQILLSDAGIFCPIHWPQPPSSQGGLWRGRDILSIPIDHRYTPREVALFANFLPTDTEQ